MREGAEAMAEGLPRPPLFALYKAKRAGVGSLVHLCGRLWPPTWRAAERHRRHFGAEDQRTRRRVRAEIEG